MHFPIIEIVSDKDQFGISVYDDATLEYFTDYYGEEYNDQERMDAINSKWFHNLFDGIGEIDAEKGEIRLYSDEKIRQTLKDYYHSLIEDLSKQGDDFDSIWQRFYGLRCAGNEYKHCSTLFFFNGCGFTSMQFIEDIIYYAGKTLYIGQIYDAHI